MQAEAGRRERPVAAVLREAIGLGDFAPNQRLIEADLSVHFGTSRAAVRSALIELAGEGLVERNHNRGARVREISRDEAIEIAEVRLSVEPFCAGRAAARIGAEEIAELRELGAALRTAVERGDLTGYVLLSRDLSRCLWELSAQRVAVDVLDRLSVCDRQYQFRLALQAGVPRRRLPGQLSVIEAVCARDAERAADAVRGHLSSVLADLMKEPAAVANQ